MTSLCHSSAERHPSSERPADATDESVMTAAREAILELGLARVTLTSVAHRAGVSRMTLYRRWPDLQGLLGDLLTREWGAAVDTVRAATRHHDSALEQLCEAAVLLVGQVRDNALFQRVLTGDPQVLLPYLLDRRGRSQELVLGHLEDLVRRGQQTGLIRVGDPAQLARSVLLVMQGFGLSARTMTDREHPEDAFLTEIGEVVRRYLAP